MGVCRGRRVDDVDMGVDARYVLDCTDHVWTGVGADIQVTRCCIQESLR
jgi:hypothetical protein